MKKFGFLNTSFVEFSSNDNGYYLRMKNGFQICWIERMDVSAGEEGKTWTFPAPFDDNNPTVIPFHRWANERYGWVGLGFYNATCANLLTLDKENGTNLTRHISAVAFGRWK